MLYKKQLGSGTTNNSASTSSGGSSSGSTTTTKATSFVTSAGMEAPKTKTVTSAGMEAPKVINNKYVASKAGMPSNIKGYASGISSVASDSMIVTGEDPNKELVIGSSLNNGTFTKIGGGGGVVNAKSTSTLAGIINSLGQGFTNGKTIEKNKQ